MWTWIDHDCAKQVFVAFTLGHRIVSDCMAHLLNHPEAAPAAWMALKGMFSLHSFCHIMDKDHGKLWRVFLKRLDDPVESNMQREALEVIACARMLDFYEFAFNCNRAESSGWDYTMVDALVSLLQRVPANSEVKDMCFRALANLLSWAWKNQHHDGCKAETLARCSALIDEIISTLSSHQGLHSEVVNGHLSTPLEVLYTFCCLGDSSINGKVRGIERFMDDLRHIVRDFNIHGALQSTAVRAAGLFIMLNPEEAGNIKLHSAESFRAREAYSELNMEKESEEDIQRAHELDPDYAAALYRTEMEAKRNDKWWLTRHRAVMGPENEKCAERQTWKNRWIHMLDRDILSVPNELTEAREPPRKRSKSRTTAQAFVA